MIREKGQAMKHARIVALLPVMLSLAGTAFAKSPPVFQPQAVNVLGTTHPATGLPFTRVWTQMPGELSMSRTQEEYVNLVPDYLMIGRTLLKDPSPIVAFMNIVWADQLLRITCRMDRANSNVVRGEFRVVMTATDGTTGNTPVGTVVGLSDGKLFRQGGLTVMTADVAWTPGIFPDVIPAGGLTMTDQLVPGLWKTDKPGRVYAKHIFTSIPPPDGGEPIIYTVQEGLPVQ
jgi:hypothetical protein